MHGRKGKTRSLRTAPPPPAAYVWWCLEVVDDEDNEHVDERGKEHAPQQEVIERDEER